MIRRFKKIRTLVIACLLGVSIVAVGIVGVIKVSAFDNDNVNKVQVRSNNKENEVKEIAKQIYKDVLEGNKQKVYAKCSDELKLELTEDILDELHNKFYSYTFKEFYDIQCSYLEENNLHYVLVIGEFEEDYIQLECYINDENKVAGIQNIIPYGNLDKNVKAIETEIFKEEVVKVGKYELTGILTLPKNKENVPVVLIVSGSGPQSANGKTYCLNPYQDIAYGLAKHGIATLRVNDRYYEKPSVATLKDTIYDEFIDDASSAIELLSNYEEIDVNNIFILGHSQGGSVIPKIAENNPNVKGMISMAGAPRSLIYAICEQYTALETIYAKTDEEKEAIKEKYNKLLEEVLNLNEYSEELVCSGLSKAYLTSLNDLNIEECIKNIEKPILVMQGDKDVNVKLEKDFELWKELLQDKENAFFKTYEGLGHFFTKSFGYPFGYGHVNDLYVENHVEDVVIKDIAEFINNNVY